MNALFDEAAAELVEGIAAVAQKLDMHRSPVHVSYQGGVVEHCPLLVERIEEQLRERLPLARLQAL